MIKSIYGNGKIGRNPNLQLANKSRTIYVYKCVNGARIYVVPSSFIVSIRWTIGAAPIHFNVFPIDNDAFIEMNIICTADAPLVRVFAFDTIPLSGTKTRLIPSHMFQIF